MIVAVIGHQDPTPSPDAEPHATGIDEHEPLARGSLVDQWLRSLAQDLVLHTQLLNLAPRPTQFTAQLLDGEGKITAVLTAGTHK